MAHIAATASGTPADLYHRHRHRRVFLRAQWTVRGFHNWSSSLPMAFRYGFALSSAQATQKPCAAGLWVWRA